MIWSWLHRHPWFVDLSIVGLLLFSGIGAAIRNGHAETTAVTLSIVATLPLLLRRSFPIAVVAIVTAVVLVMIAAGVWAVPLQLGVGLYTLTSVRERRADRAVGIA